MTPNSTPSVESIVKEFYKRFNPFVDKYDSPVPFLKYETTEEGVRDHCNWLRTQLTALEKETHERGYAKAIDDVGVKLATYSKERTKELVAQFHPLSR